MVTYYTLEEEQTHHCAMSFYSVFKKPCCAGSVTFHHGMPTDLWTSTTFSGGGVCEQGTRQVLTWKQSTMNEEANNVKTCGKTLTERKNREMNKRRKLTKG